MVKVQSRTNKSVVVKSRARGRVAHVSARLRRPEPPRVTSKLALSFAKHLVMLFAASRVSVAL